MTHNTMLLYFSNLFFKSRTILGITDYLDSSDKYIQYVLLWGQITF